MFILIMLLLLIRQKCNTFSITAQKVLSHIFSIQKETNTRQLVELHKMLLEIKHKNKPHRHGVPVMTFIL